MRLLIAGALLLSLQSALGQVVTPVVRPRAQIKPFSMTQATTTTQVYANGMTSAVTLTHVTMRDSEGRMRNENEMSASPALKLVNENGASHLIPGHVKVTYFFVNDPVERTSLSWSNNADMANEVRLVHARQGTAVRRAARTPAKSDDLLVGEEHVEKLGTRALQGVIAEGTRWTTKYPAGAFGMSQEFTVVREEWFARDFGVSVESSNDDPRTGKSVTTLVSFSDAAPDAAMFRPPADYKVISDVKVEEVAEKQ